MTAYEVELYSSTIFDRNTNIYIVFADNEEEAKTKLKEYVELNNGALRKNQTIRVIGHLDPSQIYLASRHWESK